MLRRHVDFFAVAIITFGLLAFSKASALDWPDRGGSPNFQNAINIQFCPVSDHVLSSLAHFLNE